MLLVRTKNFERLTENNTWRNNAADINMYFLYRKFIGTTEYEQTCGERVHRGMMFRGVTVY